MNSPDDEAAARQTEQLVADHHALQTERRARRAQRGAAPAPEDAALGTLLWPVILEDGDLQMLLDRADDLAYRYHIDVLDVVAAVLIHSSPSQRQRLHEDADELELMTLRLGRLKQILDALCVQVDALEDQLGPAWQPREWSAQELLGKFSIAETHWPRLLRQRRYRVEQQPTDAAAQLDVHAGAVWLRDLLPEARLTIHEVTPLLNHLGVWALRHQAGGHPPEPVRDAATRLLRQLRGLANADDLARLSALRTGRAELYVHPLMKSPAGEEW
jgi:hypothetical protein